MRTKFELDSSKDRGERNKTIKWSFLGGDSPNGTCCLGPNYALPL